KLGSRPGGTNGRESHCQRPRGGVGSTYLPRSPAPSCRPAEGPRRLMKLTPLLLAFTLTVAAATAVVGDNDAPQKKPAPKPYDDQVRPFLERHCVGCHGADKAK